MQAFRGMRKQIESEILKVKIEMGKKRRKWNKNGWSLERNRRKRKVILEIMTKFQSAQGKRYLNENIKKALKKTRKQPHNEN